MLAEKLSKRWAVPWAAVVHGWDIDVGLEHPSVGATMQKLIQSPNHLVAVSKRLEQRAG
jgi:hypothetical protein